MSRITDVQKVQRALDRAATGKNRAGRFSLTANTLPFLKSATIRDASYDEQTNELTIEFTTGKTYVYSDVDVETFQRLNEADSKGAFFNQHIRDKFRYREVMR
jgi:hypothetical protein